MTSIRRITRMLVISVATVTTSIATATVALAYPAPSDPDPAVLPPPTSIATGSGHYTLQWALTGLSGFLFVALVAIAIALVIARHGPRPRTAEGPVTTPSANVPAQRKFATGSRATPKR